jgi:hypothetical protein
LARAKKIVCPAVVSPQAGARIAKTTRPVQHGAPQLSHRRRLTALHWTNKHTNADAHRPALRRRRNSRQFMSLDRHLRAGAIDRTMANNARGLPPGATRLETP